MSKPTDTQMEDRSNWDYENLERRAPVKAPRVVVSVAFRRDDFERVAKYAERLGKKASEFIREAAVQAATDQTYTTSVQGFGNTGTLWMTVDLPNFTLPGFAREVTREYESEYQPVTSS